MDILTFISNLIGSLAWPITLIATLFIALRHGKDIAKVLHSIRYKDFQFILRDEFEKARNFSDEIQIKNNNVEKSNVVEMEAEVIRLAEIDSGVAVLKSWQKLEAKLIQLIQHNGLIRFATIDGFVQRLYELDKFSKQEMELYKWLRRIRNEVVHIHRFERPLTMSEVLEYDGFVETLIERLEKIRRDPDYVDVDIKES